MEFDKIFKKIFKKITLEETNKYPFLLAVKEDYNECYKPVHRFGCRCYIDRAFVTTAGGYSVIPDDDPCAPDRVPIEGLEDDECDALFYLTYPLTLRASQDPWEGYTYWVLQNGECSCKYLTYVRDEINKAIGKKLEKIKFKSPDKFKDAVKTKKFVSAIRKFLNFSTVNNDVKALKDILEELCEKTEKLPLEEKNDAFYRSNFYYDTGNPADNNLGIKYYDGFLQFECEYWEQSMQLIKDAAAFEWDKEFAYCDLAGRAQHISALNDIFANKINCLFYVKWKEIFDWYCEYMQPIVLTMKQAVVEKTQKANDLFKLCNHSYNQNSANYRYFDRKNNMLVQCTMSKYHPRDSINKNISDNNREFQILFQNIYFFEENEPENWEQIIEFNSLSIAKNMRIFGEFALMFLYYYGYIPAYCDNYGSIKDYFDEKYQKFETFVCAKTYPPLQNLYRATPGLSKCLDNIYDLLKNEVGTTMHNDFLWNKNVLTSHLTLVNEIYAFLNSCL